MAKEKESPLREDQDTETAPLSQEERTNGAKPQPSRPPSLLPEKMRARFQAARTLLEKPAPRTALVIPVENLDDELPPLDVISDGAKWSRRRDMAFAILGWTAVFLLALWLASHFLETLFMIVIAGLIAYALAPLVTLLTRWMPRICAVGIVYIVVLAGIGTLLYFVMSSTLSQITALTHSAENFVAPSHPGQMTLLERLLRSLGITSDQITALRKQLLTQLGGIANAIVPLLSGVAGALFDIILVIILSIYLLFEGSKVTSWLEHEVPRSQRGRIRFLLHTLQRIVGGYIRGQLLMSTLIGLLVGLGMLLFHVPYALLLGVLAFFLEFIPILGTLTSGFICVLLALTNGWISAVLVLAYFVLVHIFEGDIVGPRVVGKAVGLSPMVALIALIAGLELFGIAGALFAAPIAGVLQALIVALWSEWRAAHPEEFRRAARQLAQNIAEQSADRPVEPEPPEKLLS